MKRSQQDVFRPVASPAAPRELRVLFQLRENEATARGLQRARDDHRRDSPDVRARLVDHDHRSIRQITDRLMRIAAFFHQIQFQLVARHHHRPQGAREIGQIEHRHLLQPRHLAERLVVRQQPRLEHLRHAHQPRIDRQIAVIRAAVVNR